MNELMKRDIHNTDKSILSYQKKLKKTLSEREHKKVEQFIKDCQIGKTGKMVKSRRIVSYLQFLLKLHKYFKKDLDKITEKEAEDFIINLQKNKIKRNDGLEYSKPTKDLFVRTLKKYLGWSYGKDSKKYKNIAGWMKEERQKKSDRRAISLEQLEKVVRNEKILRNRALISFLFDSGCRIEEALNIRISDLEIKKRKGENNGEFYIVKIRWSKTKPRKISIPLATKLLTKWIKEHPIKEPNSFLFPIQYDNARRIVREATKKVLGFTLSPHELRHSSVTYYVKKFGLKDIAGFYYRFGWRFGSSEAQRYIDEHLIGGEDAQEEVVKVVEAGKVESLEKELSKLKEEYKGNMGKIAQSISLMINALKFKAEHPTKFKKMVAQARKRNPSLKKKELIVVPKLNVSS